MVVIIIISRMLSKFKGNPVVDGVFKGLRPASIGLITAALISVSQKAFLIREGSGLIGAIRWPSVALAAFLFVLMRKWKVHPVVYIAIAAAVGIVFSF